MARLGGRSRIVELLAAAAIVASSASAAIGQEAPDVVWDQPGHAQLYSAALARDAGIVGTAGGRTVKLWNGSDFSHVRTIVSDREDALSLAFTGDGSVVAVSGAAAAGRIEFWSVADGGLLRTITVGKKGVLFALSPDGGVVATLTGAKNEVVSLWDAADGALLRRLEGHTSYIQALSFSHDGLLVASAGSDLTGRVWRVADGGAVATLSGHGDVVRSLAFSPDDSVIATAGDDTWVRTWRTQTGEASWMSYAGGPVQSADFTPDGSRIVSGQSPTVDGHPTVAVWDARDGRAIGGFDAHPDMLAVLCYADSGTVAALGYDVWPATGAQRRTLTNRRIEDGTLLAELPAHRETVSSVSFSPDGGRLVSGSYDAAMCLFDAATGVQDRVLIDTDGVTSVAFSGDGASIAAGSGWNWQFSYGRASIWDAATGALAEVLPTGSLISRVRFSPDGTVLAVNDWHHRAIWLFRADDFSLVQRIGAGSDGPIAFLPGGLIAVAGFTFTDDRVEVYRIADGALVQDLRGHAGGVRALAASPDGSLLVSGDDRGELWYWRTSDWQAARVVDSGGPGVTDAAFSPDGRVLATVGGWYEATGVVRYWRSADGALLLAQGTGEDAAAGGAKALAWSPDGRTIALGRADAGVAVIRSPYSCYPDCDRDGSVGAADLACFQTRWRARDPWADWDADGRFTINDFVRYQAEWRRAVEAGGCP